LIDSKKVLEIALRAADSKKAEDIVVLNVQRVSLLADYFVITQAANTRKIGAIVDEIVKKMAAADVDVLRVEGRENKRWVLIDLGDVIVHVFQTEEREFYSLEKLWEDAPLVELQDFFQRTKD